MNKRSKIIVMAVLSLLLVLSITVFAACSQTEQKYKIYFAVDNYIYYSVETNGNETITLPTEPQKTDYTFKGWYYDKDVCEKPFSITDFASQALTENVTVYARFEKNSAQRQYKIVFIVNDLTINTVNSSGNEIITLPQAPVVDGYTFEGWYLDKDVWAEPFDGTEYQNSQLDKDIYVYARYELKKYSIFFIADGKTVDTIKTSGNQVLNLPDAPYKSNYNFMGWFFDKNTWKNALTETTYKDKALTQNISVYAYYKYSPEVSTKYAVNFWADGKNIKTVMSSGYEYIATPVAPYIKGYDFVGWYLDNNTWQKPFDGYYFSSKPITSTVNIYARYDELPKYSVRFMADNVNVSTVQSRGYESIELPAAPNKDGYEFVGWYLDNNSWQIEFDGNNYLNSAITSDVYVYAYYRKKEVKYTVKFETNGGTVIDDMVVSVINRSPVTTKVGPYEFGGWYFDSNFTQPVTFPYYPDRDVTLYAKWIEVETTFTLDENNYIIGVSGIPEDGNLVIPSYVNGVKVKGIAASTFQRNKQLISVTIPQDIKYLDTYSFSYCTNLKSVVIGDGMVKINSFAFDGCSSLTSISLPSTLTSISQGAFIGTGFKQISIPDSVEYIGQYAFKDCSNLVDIDLGSVKVLGAGVFQNCSSLQTITLPDTITELEDGGDGLFYQCKNLSSITMPKKALSIAYNILDYTAYYKNPANWQDGVLYLDQYLITINKDFNSSTYSVKEGTEVIADNAFNKSAANTTITTMYLPDGLKIIGKKAFYDNNALQSCNIPDSVEKIGNEAFRYTLLVKEGQTNYVGNWLVNYVLGSGETTMTVREGTVGIADGQITGSYNNTVTKIILPDSLKYIGIENFKYFQALTTVTSSASLKSIAANAFENCFALQEFDLSKSTGLEYIGDTAFSWCKVYDNIYIPKSVVYLGEDVFNQVTGTISMEISQAEVPDTWNSSWNGTYGPALKIQWGVSNPSA